MTTKTTVRRTVTGQTSVTVTMRDGDLAVSWTVKTYSGVKESRRQALAGARKAMEQIREEA